jgi:hypothetical protein
VNPIEGVLRKQGSPDIYIHMRQETPETWIVTLEKDGKSFVQNWPAKGPNAANPISIIKTYEGEHPGYTFTPLP